MDEYLESLARRDDLTSSGVLPRFDPDHEGGDGNYGHPLDRGSIVDHRQTRFQSSPHHRGARTFIATPPTTGTRTFRTRQQAHPREAYWKNNAPVVEIVPWNALTLQLPVLAPIEEKRTEVKQQIVKATIKALKANTRATWAEKTDLLANRFVTYAAAAQTQANSAIQDTLDYATPMFLFDNIDILDATL